MAVRAKGTGNMKFRLKAAHAAVAACLCGLLLGGCGGAVYDGEEPEISEEVGFQEYDVTAEDTEDEAIAEDDAMEDDMDKGAQGTKGSADEAAGEDKSSKGGQQKILVYEGAVSMDTMEYEDTVRAFKSAVEEYGGFLEGEQNFGAGGAYAEESLYGKTDLRVFRAVVRIPSEKYQDFMAKAEGIGSVTHSSSKVTNMTRQYGTLKAELEIYEAEYERYLKMFDEVSDDSAMVAVQEKLTELSLEIARTKNEMAAIDTDAMYSTVEAQICEVAAYKESRAGFWGRFRNVLGESWEGMLGFFEGLLFFLIMHWYKLLLLFLTVFLVIRLAKRYEKKNNRKRQQALQAYRQEARQDQAQNRQEGEAWPQSDAEADTDAKLKGAEEGQKDE